MKTYAIHKTPFQDPEVVALDGPTTLQALKVGARLYRSRRRAENALHTTGDLPGHRPVKTADRTLWLRTNVRFNKEDPMRTTTDRGTTYERFRAVILARVARGQAFYATPVDRGVAAAARATGGYARSYYRDLATRLAQSGPQVRQRIRSWFTPAEDGSLSRRQKVAIAALNVLSIPGFAVYATLEVTAAAVMTAAVGPLTLAIGLVRIVGWVLMTAAWLAAAAVALTLMLASWLLGLLVLAVMAVTAVVFLAVAFVSFLLDRAARLIAPFGLPSFQGKVTEHLLADEPTQQQPEAPRRMRPVVPQSA